MLQIFIKLCHIDPDYKGYVVMKRIDEGTWDQVSISLGTVEEARAYIEAVKGVF